MLADGSRDLYLQPEKFRVQFAADLPESETKPLALTQRPFAERAMTEASGVAAWKTIPFTLEEIPAEDLVIQWDYCTELCDTVGSLTPITERLIGCGPGIERARRSRSSLHTPPRNILPR